MKSNPPITLLAHILFAFLLCGIGRDARAEVIYSITALGSGITPRAINNSGQVVGTIQSNGDAFLYSGGTLTDLQISGGGPAPSINNLGQIVGSSEVGAWLYSGGVITNIPGLWEPVGINDSGEIVGDDNVTYQAYLYSGGTRTILTLGGSMGHAYGINNLGQVVGSSDTSSGVTHGFIYSDGQMNDLGNFIPAAVNNYGQILGSLDVTNFLYSAGTITALWARGTPFALNDNGQAVGTLSAGIGVLYSGGQLFQLNTLIPTNSGWDVEWAVAINNNGQIVAGGGGPGGASSCLLTPIHASILTQPTNVLTHAGSNATFSVGVNGASAFQWLLDGTAIPGATSNPFTISNVGQTNLGEYSVNVIGFVGDQTTSSSALLEMYPFIATPFTGLDTDWGNTNTLSVTAWGTGPLYYQWFYEGDAIDDATNSSYTINGMQFTNAGLYSVVVGNEFGTVTNESEQVVVNPAGLSLGLSPTLTIIGTPGYNYIIQRSDNLAGTNSWLTMATVTLAQPTQIWVDTNVDASLPANPQKYYRVLPGQ